MISVLVIICGTKTYLLMHTFGINRLGWLRRAFPPKHGIPSQDTFERIFVILSPAAWQRIFLDWPAPLPLLALYTVGVYSVQHNAGGCPGES
ncbi:hypothetical protein GCM10022631_33820 [Deinococcus rubellus]